MLYKECDNYHFLKKKRGLLRKNENNCYRILTRILSFLDVEPVISSIYYVIFVYIFMLIFDLYLI